MILQKMTQALIKIWVIASVAEWLGQLMLVLTLGMKEYPLICMLKEIYNRIYTFGWVRIKQKIIENNIKPVRVYTFGWVRIYSY